MQAWVFGQAGSDAMGTFANEAMGFHSPGLLSPIRSDFFFPLCKSQSRKELFICQCLHQGKRNSGTGGHGAATGCPCTQGWEPVQPGHPPAISNLWAKLQGLQVTEGSLGRDGARSHSPTHCCSLAWMKNKPMSCHPQSSSLAPSCRWARISVGQGFRAGELPP